MEISSFCVLEPMLSNVVTLLRMRFNQVSLRTSAFITAGYRPVLPTALNVESSLEGPCSNVQCDVREGIRIVIRFKSLNSRHQLTSKAVVHVVLQYCVSSSELRL